MQAEPKKLQVLTPKMRLYALYLEDCGDIASAVQMLTSLMSLQPTNVAVLAKLELLFIKLGEDHPQVKKARTILNQKID